MIIFIQKLFPDVWVLLLVPVFLLSFFKEQIENLPQCNCSEFNLILYKFEFWMNLSSCSFPDLFCLTLWSVEHLLPKTPPKFWLFGMRWSVPGEAKIAADQQPLPMLFYTTTWNATVNILRFQPFSVGTQHLTQRLLHGACVCFCVSVQGGKADDTVMQNHFHPP